MIGESIIMSEHFKLLINFAVSIFLALPVTAADGTLKKSEEGWRYHGTFKTLIRYDGKEKEVDCLKEHREMATIIQANSDFGQYSSMTRFTPVFSRKDSLEIGTTVHLKPIENLQSPLPSYEVAFASGTYSRSSQDWIMKCRTPVDIEVGSSEPHFIKKDIMTLRLPIHSAGTGKDKEYHPNTYPVRFMMANYFDRGLLETQLKFRYKEIKSSMLLGGHRETESITNPHLEVIKCIEDKKEEISKIMTETALLLESNDTSTVIANLSKKLTENPPVNTHEATNSYTCAEQANLNYLYDHRVIRVLQDSLESNHADFVGLIVHVFCSHTPCHTCATSIAREREAGGIFSQISKGKKVMISCSCMEHYQRPKRMLQYDKTTSLDYITSKNETKETIFNFSTDDSTLDPYPVVKITYTADEENMWSVDSGFLGRLRDL